MEMVFVFMQLVLGSGAFKQLGLTVFVFAFVSVSTAHWLTIVAEPTANTNSAPQLVIFMLQFVSLKSSGLTEVALIHIKQFLI